MVDSVSQLRAWIREIIATALAAVEPGACVQRVVTIHGRGLDVAGQRYNLDQFRRVIVIGAGKGTAAMAAGLEGILGDRISEGHVTVKYGYSCPLTRVTIGEAAHPVPDAAGVSEAEKSLRTAKSASADDLLFCLISGGGSSLWPAPVEGVSLADKQAVTRLLLGCGASIDEINAVRKHLSRIKGGQLARASTPASLVCLVLSDVIGDRLDIISSGPTSPDGQTFADAWSVLNHYDLVERIPASCREYLREGVAGRNPETPKPGDPVFQRVQNVVIGSNAHALAAARRCAEGLGFATRIVATEQSGDTESLAQVIVETWKEVSDADGRMVCLLWGGETTMVLGESPGQGGRNQHLALRVAELIDGVDRIAFASFGTDGTDGPTDAAGGIVDGGTVQRGRARGLEIAKHLRARDSYPFLAATGDLLVTGPTNTNVMDLQILLVG